MVLYSPPNFPGSTYLFSSKQHQALIQINPAQQYHDHLLHAIQVLKKTGSPLKTLK